MDLTELFNAFIELENDFPLSKKQREQAVDIFTGLSNEKQVQKYLSNKQDTISFAHDIIEGVYYGETEKMFRARHGDIKHLNFFDTFIYQGAVNDITDVLSSHKVSTDLLSPLRAYQNFNYDINIDDNKYTVKAIWDSDNGSPYMEEFEIRKNGILILELRTSQGEKYFYKRYNEEDKLQETFMSKNNKIINAKKDKNSVLRYRYAKGTVINGIKVGGRIVPKELL